MAAKKKDQPAPAPVNPDKVLTGADLAQEVQFDDTAFSTIGSTPISSHDGWKAMQLRISEGLPSDGWASTGKGTDHRGYDTTEQVARLIVDSIPEAYRTKEVLAQVDVRPYLAAIAKHAGELAASDAQRPDSGWEERKPVPIDAARVTEIQDTDQKRIELGLQKGQTAVTGSAQQRDALLAGARVVPAKAGLTPLADPNIKTAVAAGQDFTPSNFSNAGTQNPSFPVEDMQKIIDNTGQTLEQMASDEVSNQQRYGGGFFPVDGVQGVTPPDARPAQNHSSPAGGFGQPANTTLSLNDAMSYLRTLPPSKVVDIQNKLALAGYYDQAKSNDPISKGDPLDPATRDAWNALIKESIQTRQPVWQVLGTNSKTYREKARAARLGELGQIDVQSADATANDFAHQVIGRTLTQDELEQMKSHLVMLRDKRADFVRGAPDNPDQPLPNAQGFTNQDVQQYVQGTTTDEQLLTNHTARMAVVAKKIGA